MNNWKRIDKTFDAVSFGFYRNNFKQFHFFKTAEAADGGGFAYFFYNFQNIFDNDNEMQREKMPKNVMKSNQPLINWAVWDYDVISRGHYLEDINLVPRLLGRLRRESLGMRLDIRSVARRYEISVLVWEYFMSDCSERLKCFSTREEKFRISKRPCNVLFII